MRGDAQVTLDTLPAILLLLLPLLRSFTVPHQSPLPGSPSSPPPSPERVQNVPALTRGPIANQEKWTRTCQGDATYDPVSSFSPPHLLLLSPHPNLTQWLGMLGCLLLLLDMLHRSQRIPRNARRAFVCKGLQPPFKFFMNG